MKVVDIDKEDLAAAREAEMFTVSETPVKRSSTISERVNLL